MIAVNDIVRIGASDLTWTVVSQIGTHYNLRSGLTGRHRYFVPIDKLKLHTKGDA